MCDICKLKDIEIAKMRERELELMQDIKHLEDSLDERLADYNATFTC